MINRGDFTPITLGNEVYFVVPEPIADDFSDFMARQQNCEFVALEEGSHVRWDYTEYTIKASSLTRKIELMEKAISFMFLFQDLI